MSLRKLCRLSQISHKYVRCINTGTSKEQTQQAKATKSDDEQIVIPKAIHRSDTAVLETLASLVGRVSVCLVVSLSLTTISNLRNDFFRIPQRRTTSSTMTLT